MNKPANTPTQRSEILRLLLEARSEWVPLANIAEHAKQYNSRVFELRREGYRILNRTQDVNGERHSWFRLDSGPTSSSEIQSNGDPAPAQTAAVIKPAASMLFDTFPESYPD